MDFAERNSRAPFVPERHSSSCLLWHLSDMRKGIATEPDGLCEPCHERAAEELSRITERDRPLARLSKRERRTKT